LERWEAKKGEIFLSKRLMSIEDKHDLLSRIYSGLEVFAKRGEVDDIPDRALNIYKDTYEELNESVRSLFKEIIPYQKNWVSIKFSNIKKRF
jgi:hypothetical protein